MSDRILRRLEAMMIVMDKGDAFIVSGNGDGIFQINGSTGEITIADNTNLDYESATSYVLGVRVGDGTNTSATENVTVNVTDVNDVTPTVTPRPE